MVFVRSGFVAIVALASLVPAQAGSLVYTPVNPSFGGAPNNGAWLLQQQQVQNTFVTEKAARDAAAAQARADAASAAANQNGGAAGGLTPGQLFARTLQTQLLGVLAQRITTAIFGENAQNSGVFQVEGTTISFQRVGTNVQLSINDGLTITNITVPAAP